MDFEGLQSTLLRETHGLLGGNLIGTPPPHPNPKLGTGVWALEGECGQPWSWEPWGEVLNIVPTLIRNHSVLKSKGTDYQRRLLGIKGTWETTM